MKFGQFLRFFFILIFCTSFAHADGTASGQCPYVTAFEKFLNTFVDNKTGGLKNQEQCVADLLKERKVKNDQELAAITQQIELLQAKLKTLEYGETATIVFCEPKNGPSPNPQRSADCHTLNDAINGLTDRQRQLAGWFEDLPSKVNYHTVTEDPKSIPGPPPPDANLCKKLQVARAFSGEAMERFIRECDGTN